MFKRLRKAYRKGITVRLGLGAYFFQFTIRKSWWQLLLRIGGKGYVYNKHMGFFTRKYIDYDFIDNK